MLTRKTMCLYVLSAALVPAHALAQDAAPLLPNTLPRFETRPLTREDRVEIHPVQTSSRLENQILTGASQSLQRLTNDRAHWQTVANFIADSTPSETLVSLRMAAISQDPYSQKNNTYEIKNQITNQYSKNTQDHFKDLPLLQKYKSGFQYQLNFTDDKKIDQPVRKPANYGLLIEDITPVKAADIATMGAVDYKSESRQANVRYTIGPLNETDSTWTKVDENMTDSSDEGPNFLVRNFNAPSPNMRFDFLPGSAGGVPGTAGSKLALTQVEGLFRNELTTANGENPQKTNQMIKFPIYRALCVIENYENAKILTQTTYGGLLVNDGMPNLSLTKNHIADTWRSDLAWTKNVHTFKAAAEMTPSWKPGNKTLQEGERYTIEYSRPI